MTVNFGNVDAGITLYIPFATYAGGASITMSGLLTSDIEIYKNGANTTRSSDNGYALLDTDGIDFASKTGIHGFSVDLNDNSDAGFFSAGAFYWVIVSSITVDSQVVNVLAATFRIGPAAANTTQWNGTAVASPHTAGYPVVTIKDGTGTGEIDTNAGAIVAVTTTATVTNDPTGVTTLLSRMGTPSNLGSGATVAANLVDIENETDDIGTAGAGLTVLATQASVDDLPTNAELATALGTADDAVLTAIAALPSAATITAAVWAQVIETGFTAIQSLRLILSAAAGKLSGAATTTVVIRDVNDAKDRITATVDADGNRTAVTKDVS